MEQLGRGDPGVWTVVIRGNALGSRARVSEKERESREGNKGV